MQRTSIRCLVFVITIFMLAGTMSACQGNYSNDGSQTRQENKGGGDY